MLTQSKSLSKTTRSEALSQHESVMDWHQTNCCSCALCLDECYEENCPACIPNITAYPTSVEQSGSQFVPTAPWPWIRGFFGLFSIVVLIWDIADWISRGVAQYWLIYLTHWTFIITTLYLTIGFVETVVLYRAFVAQERIVTLEEIGWVTLGRVSRALFNISMSAGVVVAILFWTLLFDIGNFTDNTDLVRSIIKHGGAAACVLIDGFVGASWLRHKDAIYVFVFAFTYTIWSVIHWALHIGNENGKDYIYSVLNWNNPGTAAGYAALVNIVLPVIHFVLVFAINYLRNTCGVERVWDNLPIMVPVVQGQAPKTQMADRAGSASPVFRTV